MYFTLSRILKLICSPRSQERSIRLQLSSPVFLKTNFQAKLIRTAPNWKQNPESWVFCFGHSKWCFFFIYIFDSLLCDLSMCSFLNLFTLSVKLEAIYTHRWWRSVSENVTTELFQLYLYIETTFISILRYLKLFIYASTKWNSKTSNYMIPSEYPSVSFLSMSQCIHLNILTVLAVKKTFIGL